MKTKTIYLIFLFWLAILTGNAFAQKNNTTEAPSVPPQAPVLVNNSLSALTYKVKIFPEEITSYLYIHVGGHTNTNATIVLKDIYNRTVINENIIVKQTQKFSVNALPRGTYLLTISVFGVVIKSQTIVLI